LTRGKGVSGVRVGGRLEVFYEVKYTQGRLWEHSGSGSRDSTKAKIEFGSPGEVRLAERVWGDNIFKAARPGGLLTSGRD